MLCYTQDRATNYTDVTWLAGNRTACTARTFCRHGHLATQKHAHAVGLIQSLSAPLPSSSLAPSIILPAACLTAIRGRRVNLAQSRNDFIKQSWHACCTSQHMTPQHEQIKLSINAAKCNHTALTTYHA